jgi:hypothetical protein
MPLMSDATSLVGLLLFLVGFLVWWYQTIPVYRERARAGAARRRWREQLSKLPSATAYRPELRVVATYTPRPFTGDRFPGNVPATYSSSLAEPGPNDEVVYGMPSFAAAPRREAHSV